MSRFFRWTPGRLTVVLTLMGVGLAFFQYGGRMFSPGHLNGQNRKGTNLGGVMSHAELSGQCAACHPAPWSGAAMADRCLDCHVQVRRQIESGGPLHGKLTGNKECRQCHAEHLGPRGALTNLEHFDHDNTAFPLTGKHRTVACVDCHPRPMYQGTPQACAACHAEPAVHKGKYGNQCQQCHGTATFAGAHFKHMFPLDHRNKKKPIACATCHAKTGDYKTYTCYGCHAHTPQKVDRQHARRMVSNLNHCVECHPTGRGHVGKGGRPRGG